MVDQAQVMVFRRIKKVMWWKGEELLGLREESSILLRWYIPNSRWWPTLCDPPAELRTLKMVDEFLIEQLKTGVRLNLLFPCIGEMKLTSYFMTRLILRGFFWFFFLDYLFCSTGDWTQGLDLARQLLYHLSHTPVILLLVCFSDRISC
jgi:hypothetical protein